MHPQHPKFSSQLRKWGFETKGILWRFQTQQTQNLSSFRVSLIGQNKNEGRLRLTSHDTTVNYFAISIEKFGYVFGPSIRRKFCKSS